MRRGMRSLRDLVDPSVGNHDVSAAARAQKVLRRWDEAVGPALAKRSNPDRYDRGTVWVAVQGAAWAQELRLRRELILGRLCEMAGERTLFTDLRFGVRPLPGEEGGPELIPVPVKPERNPEFDGLSIREIAERRLAQWQEGDKEP